MSPIGAMKSITASPSAASTGIIQEKSLWNSAIDSTTKGRASRKVCADTHFGGRRCLCYGKSDIGVTDVLLPCMLVGAKVSAGFALLNVASNACRSSGCTLVSVACEHEVHVPTFPCASVFTTKNPGPP